MGAFKNVSLTPLLMIVLLGAALATTQVLSFKIPPLSTSVKIYVTLNSVEFRVIGSGRLAVALDG